MKIVIIALALLTSASAFAGQIKKAPPVTKAFTEANFVRVSGNSMKATMPDGSLWVAEPVKLENCKIGDVVVFYNYRTAGLVVHRIVRKEGSFYVTKGDSNIREDLGVISNKNLRLRIVAAPKLATE